ncbi:DEAD/DEAH box helicase family protein [Helcococcus kunzii]|uniref:DEAD/DEAH box helicase family protein n=1 Tax=Helcococcus kunzii TaxID=40091 RepID=UPI0038A70906
MVEPVQRIETKTEINPTIYAYITPQNISNNGWIKIGYTERDSKTRINEQTHTAGVLAEELWNHVARYNDGKYFKDTDFHSYLTRHGVKRKTGTEWFFFNGNPEFSEEMFQNFTFHKDSKSRKQEGTQYELRKEQSEAVKKAYEYFIIHEKGEFLWNAKPRFGKTLSSYDLARKLDARNVLIVTNRPAIANSWYDDFEKFIEWQTDYKFISETSSLKDKPTWTRQQFIDESLKPGLKNIRNITFISLQDLKGSVYMGGKFEKLRWVTQLDWDLLIIDEAHEGVDTYKTDTALDFIKRKHTLHLSGTPFKQLANSKFAEEQIYNWSYVDEQESKEEWKSESFNPYSNLPKLNMFTYQLSNMIVDKLNRAGIGEKDDIDYTFDLNEFFSTQENGKFKYEDQIKKWLDTLTRNEKYPFSTYELRSELKHTFWFLDRVASAEALAELLKRDPVFGNGNYEIVVVAGQNNSDGEKNLMALERVRKAIKEHDKTITISVGQLTTGVTVPEWSAVMMLNNVKSPALYMQAAFRAQNPHQWIEKDARGVETLYKKENAYIFDFAPERTLIIVDEFANNLNASTASAWGTSDKRSENIKTLLNFFPVIGEDSQGKMVQIDAKQVMTIPKNIKAREVVRRGFMSNLLFTNISGIFQSPRAVIDIINQFEKTEDGKTRTKDKLIDSKDVEKVDVDENNEVIIDNDIVVNKSKYIFGEKKFEVELIPADGNNDDISNAKNIAKEMVNAYKNSGDFDKLKDEYKLSSRSISHAEKELLQRTEDLVKRHETELKVSRANNKADLKKELEKSATEEERDFAKKNFEEKEKSNTEDIANKFKELLEEERKQFEKDTIERFEKEKEEKVKVTIDKEIRSRLRGFARTIPSFLMAYGDENLTLQNFDKYTPEDVFKEVTSISIDQFKFLRDGGDYFDEEDVKEKHFEGKLFDEIVFNQSVQEFLAKREELADYFEDNEEDIFDYIPNQQTNQIFTPKWVVQMMVQQLEDENPGIYDDSSKTFIDLYMKSGLYITEIVKRLYNSETIKDEIPDDKLRIKHILENQVYGLAPTEIIYRIALRFIFGNFDESISKKNFKMLDAYPYAEAGTLEQKLDSIFGEDTI